uniref:Chromosome 8 open reading frame 76 n=1 Tax=Meleagris gallopavo TaxID=9103 RepID=G1NJ06_MELGA
KMQSCWNRGGPWACREGSRETFFGEEDAEVLTAQKFRADLAYREREFEKALCEYSNCLQHLPPSNIAMRRDVQEGQARCLSQLGRHKEALDIAERMRNSATNTDHLTTVLNLQFAIYRDLENVEKKIVCLQQLICLHPFNPWYWMSLAEAYMDLLRSLSPFCIPETNLHCSKEVSDGSFGISAGGKINLQPHRSDCQRECPQSCPAAETKSESAATCSSSQAVTEMLCTSDNAGRKAEGKQAACESWEPDMAKDVGVKACASFVRLTQLQQSSFALENNIKCQKEIDDKVAQFGLNENSLLQMTKVMGADLIPEKLKEEFQGEVKCIGSSALSSLVTASASEFEIKWFDILRDDLCHLDRQFSSDIHIPPLAT